MGNTASGGWRLIDSFHYADDTIIFMDHDFEKARNPKLILSAFEQLTGLKINFHKSELFFFGDAQDKVNGYATLFGYGQGQFPMRYFGIPVHYRRLTIAEWKLVEERLQKRLSSWKGKNLINWRKDDSHKLVTHKHGMAYDLFFLVPKGVLHKLD
jgi:hypothetical protein